MAPLAMSPLVSEIRLEEMDFSDLEGLRLRLDSLYCRTDDACVTRYRLIFAAEYLIPLERVFESIIFERGIRATEFEYSISCDDSD